MEIVQLSIYSFIYILGDKTNGANSRIMGALSEKNYLELEV